GGDQRSRFAQRCRRERPNAVHIESRRREVGRWRLHAHSHKHGLAGSAPRDGRVLKPIATPRHNWVVAQFEFALEKGPFFFPQPLQSSAECIVRCVDLGGYPPSPLKSVKSLIMR